MTSASRQWSSAATEHLNFRYAANVLGVTQSSVSSRVKALEETRAAFRTTASRRPAHRNRIFTRDGGRWGIGHYEKCGGAMTIRTGKGGCCRYYTCSIKARHGETGCSGRSIPMSKLDAIVCDHVENRLLQPERLEEILASILDRREEKAERRREHIAELNS